MDTTPFEADVVANGPEPRRQRRGLATAAGLVAAGVVAGAALGLSSGATAQIPSQTPGQTAPEDAPAEKMRRGPGRGHGPGHKLGGAGIHGEFVVKKADGTFQTMLSQRGAVTAVSATSITVRSEDGYTTTYVVNGDTKVNRDGAIGDIAVGDTVGVLATESGSTATATRIHEPRVRPAARAGTTGSSTASA